MSLNKMLNVSWQFGYHSNTAAINFRYITTFIRHPDSTTINHFIPAASELTFTSNTDRLIAEIRILFELVR